MYAISIFHISIKTNFKQIGWIKMCTILWVRLHFVNDVTLFFPIHSPTASYSVLSHIPMVWRHIKVVQQITSHARSRHYYITIVLWYTLVSYTLYQLSDFRIFQRKTYIMLDKGYYKNASYALNLICTLLYCLKPFTFIVNIFKK